MIADTDYDAVNRHDVSLGESLSVINKFSVDRRRRQRAAGVHVRPANRRALRGGQSGPRSADAVLNYPWRGPFRRYFGPGHPGDHRAAEQAGGRRQIVALAVYGDGQIVAGRAANEGHVRAEDEIGHQLKLGDAAGGERGRRDAGEYEVPESPVINRFVR